MSRPRASQVSAACPGAVMLQSGAVREELQVADSWLRQNALIGTAQRGGGPLG